MLMAAVIKYQPVRRGCQVVAEIDGYHAGRWFLLPTGFASHAGGDPLHLVSWWGTAGWGGGEINKEHGVDTAFMIRIPTDLRKKGAACAMRKHLGNAWLHQCKGAKPSNIYS